MQESEAEIDALVDSQPTALLVTSLRAGIFNPVRVGGAFVLHLHRKDEQILALREDPRALLVFQDILATIPSHWIDEHYGGAATQYYRFAEYEVSARVIEDPEQIRAPLQAMLDRFQPEGGYTALDPEHKLYKGSFGEIVLVELAVVARRTKWKLGQNRPEAKRREVIAHLRERGRPRDAEAAREVEKTLRSADVRAP